MRAARPALAAALAAVLTLQTGPGRAAPGDIFTIPAPVIGADPPKGAELKAGDVSVATTTGALSFGYPITVPPGRNGMAPRLALTYSSQAPIYGDIAAGWSLPIGIIRADTSAGTIANQEHRFTSSIAGESRLVQVTEPAAGDVLETYRVAHGDASFARYERVDPLPGNQFARWRVRTPDGITMVFGESPNTPGCAIYHGYAPLTRTIDSFGNEVKYEYTAWNGECRIDQITWGQNQGAGLAAFASVEFEFVPAQQCNGVPIGSQTYYRDNRSIITGASTLVAIRAYAFAPSAPSTPLHTREISLVYEDTSCARQHAPVRLLSRIVESASGADSPLVALPPVHFEYGDPNVNLSTPLPQANPFSGVDPNPLNLGWGYRRTDDRWSTVEAMMLDIDGDGLLDRVFNGSTASDCIARWQRNTGPNQSGVPSFQGIGEIPLPRLKWTDNATAMGLDDGCALNGQYTAFANSFDTNGICHDSGWSPCVPGQFCAPNGTRCPEDPAHGPGPFRTYLAYRWLDMDADGLVDLVAAVHGDIDRYDIEMGNLPGFRGVSEPLRFGPWPACSPADTCKDIDPFCGDIECDEGVPCPIDPGTLESCLTSAPDIECFALAAYKGNGGVGAPGNGSTYRTPYLRCEGLYPWFIYKNVGNGQFEQTPIIKYQPVQLESDQGDSAVGGRSVVATNHAIMDFDGDGRLDALISPDTPLGWVWQVFLGDGLGGFGEMHAFQTRAETAISGIGATNGSPSSTFGLLDLNGDGLLDQWQLRANGGANIAWHYGTWHRILGTSSGGVGEVNTPYGVRPGNDSLAIITVPQGGNGPVQEGYTQSTNRVTDVDNDGRPDVVQLSGGTPALHLNVGGQFTISPVAYPGDTNGLERRTKVESAGTIWKLESDLIDLDGNGIPESVRFGPLMNSVVHSNAAPPRLLRKIKNGRGLETTVSYSSMHDPSHVVQRPDLTWFDDRPMATPNPRWVVKSLHVFDEFANTTAASSYKYEHPRHGPDDEGRFAFRGFEQVTITSPSNAKTVERYAYDIDWSGRLVETRVHPAEAPSEVRSITRQEWETHTLFGGLVRAILPTETKNFTCSNTQDIAACELNPAAFTMTTTTYTALDNGGPDLLWAETESLLGGESPADGDRKTSSTYALHGDYRLRLLTSEQTYRDGVNWVGFGKSATAWDSTLRVPLTDEVWLNNADSERAITHFAYDMATGNLIERWKPEQYPGPHTTYDYDDRKLFVDLETNELGQQMEYIYEYGTGTKLETLGPNTAGATKERHKIRIDGIGRTIEQHESISINGASYSDVQLTAITNHIEADVITNPHTPATSTSSSKILAGGTAWTQEKAEFDGHGRPTKKTVFVQGSAAADHITTFDYRNDGTLESVQVPDSSVNDSSTVSYTYTFDSLGRVTSLRRPDALSPGDRSGIDIVYNGVTKTVTEFVGAAGGESASTMSITDQFGRLVEVREQTGPMAWAFTYYTYGPDDLVSQIVDPEGVTTSLTHDFAGRRTMIARHGRVWAYTYDKNGNLESEQAPGSFPGDTAYVTSIVYDDLDRPIERLIGQRLLSATDEQAFGSHTEVMSYDNAPNGVGRLISWQTFAPSAATATNSETFSYDAQGRRTNINQTFDGSGYIGLQRNFYREWNLLGGPTLTKYLDFLGGPARTESSVHYDARGLPLQIDLTRTGEASYTVKQGRNVAGLVTSRGTKVSGTIAIGSTWAYDALGRVVDQHVETTINSVNATKARQQFTYFGNDDVSTLTHTLGLSAKTFQYSYDKRHQLTSANETTTAGYFTSSYLYGPAGRLVNVNLAQPNPPSGSELATRHVDYQYADADPERVTALLEAGSSMRYATYQYDDAGNQISRCYGPVHTPKCTGMSVEFTYDGNDQLRRSVKLLNGVLLGSEEYFYNSGQRFAVVERDANGDKVELTWTIGDTEAHYDSLGSITHIYAHVSLGTPVARVDRSSNATSSMEFKFHGIANSKMISISPIGDAISAFSYSPFGEVIASVGSNANQRRRFNDKQESSLVKLSYYGYRYYDPIIAHWTQSDPWLRFIPDFASARPRLANLYQFSLNNPLRYLDPDGRVPAGTIILPVAAQYKSKVDDNRPPRGGETKSMGLPIPGAVGRLADLIWDLGEEAFGDKGSSGNASGSDAPPIPLDIPDPPGRRRRIGGSNNPSGAPRETNSERAARESREAAEQKQRIREGRVPKSELPNRKDKSNQRQLRDADSQDLIDKKISIERAHPENRTGKTDQRNRERMKEEAKEKPQDPDPDPDPDPAPPPSGGDPNIE